MTLNKFTAFCSDNLKKKHVEDSSAIRHYVRNSSFNWWNLTKTHLQPNDEKKFAYAVTQAENFLACGQKKYLRFFVCFVCFF